MMFFPIIDNIFCKVFSKCSNITDIMCMPKVNVLKTKLKGNHVENQLKRQTDIFRYERSWRIGFAMYRGKPHTCPCCGPDMF